MSRSRLWFVCGIAVLSFLLPSLIHAQEAPTVPVQPSASLDTPQPDSGATQQTITLEELKKRFGPQNVCGAYCGYFGAPKCRTLCGDAAACINNYCVLL